MMGTFKPGIDLRRVTLSVYGHVYTSEILRLCDSHWCLLVVEVHGIGMRTGLQVEATSCLQILVAAEQVAQQILCNQG